MRIVPTLRVSEKISTEAKMVTLYDIIFLLFRHSFYKGKNIGSVTKHTKHERTCLVVTFRR